MSNVISGRRFVRELSSYLCDIHRERTGRGDFKVDPSDDVLHRGFNLWFDNIFAPNENDRYIDLEPPNITGYRQGIKDGLFELANGHLVMKTGKVVYKINVPPMNDDERRVKSITRESVARLYDLIHSCFLNITW